jgi:endoglucanase
LRPGLSAFCGLVAAALAALDRTFCWQRMLMVAGSCVSAAFFELGYDATGVCIALGNYHNVDRQRRRIDSEYIDLNDWEGMVRWFVALATARRPYRPGGDPDFARRLEKIRKEWTPLLLKTVAQQC